MHLTDERCGPIARLTRWDWIILALFVTAALAFCGLVVLRTALLQRRRGDLGCYPRAAAAVRCSPNPYQVRDHFGWDAGGTPQRPDVSVCVS